MLTAKVSRWHALAAAAAARHGATYGVKIDPLLVLAMIARESSGDPAAVNREPDGELSRGLLQVKHSTAIDLGVRDPRALLQPAVAIDAGVRYFAQQLRRYRGMPWHAVAAYNAGPGNVRFDQRERFVNQEHVDAVRRYHADAIAWARARKFTPGGGAGDVASGVALVAIGGALGWALMRGGRRRAA